MEMVSSVFKLRELNKHDFDAWKKVWGVYLGVYDTTVKKLVHETTFGRLVSRDNKSQHAIVALKNNEMVGLVHYIFHPDNWSIEDDCYCKTYSLLKP